MQFTKDWKFITIVAITVIAFFVLALGGPFKKGMDVAGGVELTYLIDFAKYGEMYPNRLDYENAVSNAKNIIKTNITKRVNSMGVGDTEVKLLKVGDKDYIQVKIGGIEDIEVAKATIGKTVELEFKVLNEQEATPEQIATRKLLAEDLLTRITEDPSKMKELTENRAGDDIYYETITRNYEVLPKVYQDNADQLKNLSGLANQIIEGIYADQLDANGQPQVIKGFFIINIKNKTTTQNTMIGSEKFSAIASEFGLTLTSGFELNYKPSGETILTGVVQDGADFINTTALYEGVQAYLIDGYMVESTSGIVNNLALSELTTALEQGQNINETNSYIKIIDSQWLDLATLQQIDPTISINTGDSIKTLTSNGETIVLQIKQTKTTTDTLDQVITISGITDTNREPIINNLKINEIYTVEQVFVRDTTSWTQAIEHKTNKALNGAYFQSASTMQGPSGLPVVTINFNNEGAQIFCNLTEELVGKQMAIFVGGKLVTNPTIKDKICAGQAQIDGTFTDQTCVDPKDPTKTHTAKTTNEGAKCLVSNLNEGALPAPLMLSHESTLKPTLGDNAWNKAAYATGAGLILIFTLIWYMYGITKAIIATISLAVYILVQLAVVKATSYALSLSGMAAIILNIGMGVDSSILIFERLKEELQRGLDLKTAILTAYERSWAPIFDGNVSTGLIGLIMAMIGSDIFQGFGLMMFINNIILLAFTAPLTKYLLLFRASRAKK